MTSTPINPTSNQLSTFEKLQDFVDDDVIFDPHKPPDMLQTNSSANKSDLPSTNPVEKYDPERTVLPKYTLKVWDRRGTNMDRSFYPRTGDVDVQTAYLLTRIINHSPTLTKPSENAQDAARRMFNSAKEELWRTLEEGGKAQRTDDEADTVFRKTIYTRATSGEPLTQEDLAFDDRTVLVRRVKRSLIPSAKEITLKMQWHSKLLNQCVQDTSSATAVSI